MVVVMEDENKRKVFVKLVTGPRSVRESHLHNHFAKLKGLIEEVSVTRGRDTAHAWVRFNTTDNTYLHGLVTGPYTTNTENYHR